MTDTSATPVAPSPTKPVLSNQVYDVLKYIAQIVLPALGTFYFAVAQIWGLPFAGKVVGSITAADVFLGLLLGLSSMHYARTGAAYDGTMDVTPMGEGVLNFMLNLDGHPAELADKDKVTFKVNKSADVPPAQ